VGNCFLRILETAGNFPAEISSGKANYIRRKWLVRVGEITLPVNVSCELSACNSAAYSASNAAAELFSQVIPQETDLFRRKFRRKLLFHQPHIFTIFYY